MENKKNSRPMLYYGSRLLTTQARFNFIKSMTERKCRSYILNLPDDLLTIRNILFILPEDLLEAFHQVANIISIIRHFNDIHPARVTLLCEKTVAPYFKNLPGVNAVIEYNAEDRFLFSRELTTLKNIFVKEYIDLCLFLERDPDLSLLHLVGQIGIKIRATYADVGSFPFFNLQIKNSGQHIHRTDRNNIMATVFGAKLHETIHWSIPKEKLEEISILLKEYGVPDKTWLGGIDAELFYQTFGQQWTDALIETLKARPEKTWYLYAQKTPEDSFLSWLKAKNIAVFSDFTPSQLAALLYKSNLFISGKSALFALTNLLHAPCIGLFETTEIDSYYKQTQKSMGISYANKPDAQTIELINEKVRSFS